MRQTLLPRSRTRAFGRSFWLRNILEELLILASMAAALGFIAWLLAGSGGLLAVLTVALIVGALRPRVPVAWILRLYHAQPLPYWMVPGLHETVAVLAKRAGLHRRPAVFYVSSPTPNAFVVGGRENATLAITDGLLRLLNGRQLTGVVAHELSHLRNGDTSAMNVSDLIAGLARWMGRVGLWSLFLTVAVAIGGRSLVPLLISLVLLAVPTFVTLTQLALYRSREYDADLGGVALTGDPEGLAGALSVLESTDVRVWERILVGPSGAPDPLLLQTHPPTEERIRRLRALQIASTRRRHDEWPSA